MTNEEAAALSHIPREGYTALGYGPPSDMTKVLAAMQYIEIEIVQEVVNGEKCDFWHACLTARGRAVISVK